MEVIKLIKKVQRLLIFRISQIGFMRKWKNYQFMKSINRKATTIKNQNDSHILSIVILFHGNIVYKYRMKNVATGLLYARLKDTR